MHKLCRHNSENYHFVNHLCAFQKHNNIPQVCTEVINKMIILAILAIVKGVSWFRSHTELRFIVQIKFKCAVCLLDETIKRGLLYIVVHE